MLFFCPIADEHWGMVCLEVMEGLYVTLRWRWSWPCVMHVKVACVCDPTGCVERMADVGCVSGGCDSGARPACVSSDGTYGRSL